MFLFGKNNIPVLYFFRFFDQFYSEFSCLKTPTRRREDGSVLHRGERRAIGHDELEHLEGLAPVPRESRYLFSISFTHGKKTDKKIPVF